MSGLKQDDLRNIPKCLICDKKIGQIKPLQIFWDIDLKRHGLDLSAINRHTGLENILGNALLARAMGTDEDLTMQLDEKKIMICDPCMIERFPEIFDKG